MALPTQTEANKTGVTPILGTDSDGVVYNTIGGVRLIVGTGTPNAAVTAPKGSLMIEVGGPKLYMNTDAGTTWEVVGGQS